MPNVGRPSRDCHLCRSRRVKCDLGRPGCQRCVKYGVECPGYRDQQDLLFRNVSVGRQQQRAGQRSSSLSSTSSSSSSLSVGRVGQLSVSSSGTPSCSTLLSQQQQQQQQTPPRISRSLLQHWTTHSVPIVLTAYSALDFLHATYRSYPDDGPLVWVAHLFARTYVTNLQYPTAIQRESRERCQRELGMYLGKTLNAVAGALRTEEGVLRDDVVAVVWMLANYEMLVGNVDPKFQPSVWHVHARGMYSILKTRGARSFYTKKGRVAFWVAFSLIQVESIISGTECPPESEQWLEMIKENMEPVEQMSLTIATFLYRVTKIQNRMLTLLRTNDCASASIEYDSLVDGLKNAEKEVQAGFFSFEEDLSFWDTWWQKVFYGALVKTYHIAQALTNNLTHYPDCQIPLEELLAQRRFFLEKLRSAADQVLAFVPTTLVSPKNNNTTTSGGGSSERGTAPASLVFEVIKLIWPLVAVYNVPNTLPGQKTVAELALMFIAQEVGVRQALCVYPGSTSGLMPPEGYAPLFGESEMVNWVGRLH